MNSNIAFEALEIVLNELKFRLEKSNENLRQYISDTIECSNNDLDGKATDDLMQGPSQLMLEMNSLVENGDLIVGGENRDRNSSRPLLPTSIEDATPTGIEAVSIILGHGHDALQELRLLKMENYLLTEEIQCGMLTNQLHKLSAEYGYQWPPVDKDPPVVVMRCRLSRVIRMTEERITRSSDEVNIQYARSSNENLLQELKDIDEVESDETFREASMFGYDFSRFELIVNLNSLGKLAQDCQDAIPAPLLIMENKYFTRKAKGMILRLKLIWLREQKMRCGDEMPPSLIS